MLYITNSFSIQMLTNTTVNLSFRQVTTAEAKKIATANSFVSTIGHSDTANVVSSILGKEVKMNRASIKMEATDTLLVAQLTGGRLPEGATAIPEGMDISFWVVYNPENSIEGWKSFTIGPCGLINPDRNDCCSCTSGDGAGICQGSYII